MLWLGPCTDYRSCTVYRSVWCWGLWDYRSSIDRPLHIALDAVCALLYISHNAYSHDAELDRTSSVPSRDADADGLGPA